MNRRVWVVSMVLALLALAVVGLSSRDLLFEPGQALAWAAEENAPKAVRGRIVKVGAESLTVQTNEVEVEVSITPETVFRVPGVSEATLADVKEGAWVQIRSEMDEDGGLKAIVVVVRPPQRWQEYFVRGTVTAVDEAEILLETGESQVARVLVDNRTRFWVPGEPPTTAIDLAVGDPLLVLGRPAEMDPDQKVFSARLVVVAGDKDLPRVVIRGRVVAVTRQTIVVEAGRGERAITVLPRTQLWSAQGRFKSLRDLPRGQQVVALGQPTEMGQWLAGLVFVSGSRNLARP